MHRLFLMFVLVLPAAAHAEEEFAADINETVFKLPTTVRDRYLGQITRDMVVTQYKPDGNGPFPIAVLLHGRSPTDRSRPARQRYVQAARYFVRRGFAVWIPTRIGYGASGTHPDPEDSGHCTSKLFPPAFEAAAASALVVIDYAKRQSFVDPHRIIVLGQSFGGATSIALAAKNPPDLVGVINFAGGSGGDPVNQPGNPCRPDLLGIAFAGYGKTARIPTLWIYTANDKYFGPEHPKQWFATYSANGGTGEFKAMAAFGDDGHLFFSRGFAIWRPIVDDFLAHRGFPLPKSADAPQPSGYAALSEIEKVPLVKDEGREKYKRFLELDIPRAYAIGPHGEYAYYSARDATERVMAMCSKRAKTGCKLYAVDDQVVWKE